MSDSYRLKKTDKMCSWCKKVGSYDEKTLHFNHIQSQLTAMMYHERIPSGFTFVLNSPSPPHQKSWTP